MSTSINLKHVNNKDKSMWTYIPDSDISYHSKNKEIPASAKTLLNIH